MDNKYSVSQLSDSLELPRTTINDWLSRYSQYIDFQIQGKRKVYLDSSLNVLREIGVMRDQGLSSFDIEQELSKRHPVHGEVTSPTDSEKSSDDQVASSQNASPQNNSSASSLPVARGNEIEEFAMIAKKQSDELANLLGEGVQNMLTKVDDLEHFHQNELKRSNHRFFIALTVVLILSLVCFYAFWKINESLLQNRELALKNQTLDSAVQTRETELKRTQMELAGLNQEKQVLTQNFDTLKKDLEKQEAEFKNVLEIASKDARKTKEVEVLEMRNKFAAEKLEIIKSMEALKKEKADALKQIEKQQNLFIQSQREHEQEIGELKKHHSEQVGKKEVEISDLWKRNHQQTETIRKLSSDFERLLGEAMLIPNMSDASEKKTPQNEKSRSNSVSTAQNTRGEADDSFSKAKTAADEEK